MLPLKGNMEERAVTLAQYIIESGATVRAAAEKFALSKSTVHTVLVIRVGSQWSLRLPVKRPKKRGRLAAAPSARCIGPVPIVRRSRRDGLAPRVCYAVGIAEVV